MQDYTWKNDNNSDLEYIEFPDKDIEVLCYMEDKKYRILIVKYDPPTKSCIFKTPYWI